MYHKNFFPTLHFNVVAPMYHQFWRVLFNQIPLQPLSFKLIEQFFTQLFKIVPHFQNRSDRLCFLTHPSISLIIVERQNYFYQTFCLKKTFTKIGNKTHLPIWNFNAPPHPRKAGMSSIFASTDISLKNITFRSKVYFSRYLTGLILLLHPVYMYNWLNKILNISFK